LGWKMVPGSESWGNYFWAVKKGVWSIPTRITLCGICMIMEVLYK
jgi:hypothetical protein